MQIINYIPYGQANAISRHDLCRKSGLKDRKMRRAVHQARREHVILQFGGGYYIPTIAEKHLVEKWIRQESNRAKSTFWALRAARNFVKKLENIA